MKRRQMLYSLAGLALATAGAGRAFGVAMQTAAERREEAKLQADWRSLLPKEADVTLSTDPIQKTEAEWRQQLGVAKYHVLREEGTEYPFSSPLNNEKRSGVFVCAGCGLPHFTSEMKFDSGTGWPSFFTSIPGHLTQKQDFKLIYERDEYHCVRCGGHQGHVFNDGPRPTGQRWCNNGIAQRFIPTDGKA